MSGPHVPFVESFMLDIEAVIRIGSSTRSKNHKNHLPVLSKPFSNINIPEETLCL